MATAIATASASTPTQAFGQPPMPYFICALDRRTNEAYLRSRATAFLQRQYKQLLQVPEGEEFPAYVNPYKRAREAEDEINGTGTGAEAVGVAGGTNKRVKQDQRELPHIDSTFMLELTTAKPEAGVLAVGDAPDDVYLPALPKGKRDDHRALIGALIDRTIESDTLFWDLKRLNHAQVKALAETEWSRQLPVTPTAAKDTTGSTGATTGTRSSRRQQQQIVSEEEREFDEEIASIRRAFCDKTRAQALAARAAAGW